MDGLASNVGHRHDVIVVGGGAAGLNAALMLARAGRDTLVIDAGQPRNRFADHMHGYLSRDGMPPGELLDIGRAEVEGYGGAIRNGTVVDAAVNETGTRVSVTLDDGNVLHGRRLLVTTGVRDELPPIEGLAERWGKDVLHCPYCHGHEVRNLPLGVIATGPMSLHQVTLIRQWSPDLVYFLNGQEPPEPAQVERLEARGIRLVEGRVTRLVVAADTDRLAGVELEDGTVIARAAVFVATTLALTGTLLTGLGADIERNEVATWVVTERGGKTSVPGVWAAGNVAEPMAQVIGAAASGAMAGAVINMSLVEEEFDQALATVTEETIPTR